MRVTTRMLNESSQRAGIPGGGSGSIENNALLKAATKNKKGNSLLSSIGSDLTGKMTKGGKTSGFDNENIRKAADTLKKKAEKLSKDNNTEEAEKMKKIADKLTEYIPGNYSQDGALSEQYKNRYDFWG